MTPMKATDKYADFLNSVCEILHISKPHDVLKLCVKIDEFLHTYEKRLNVLEHDNFCLEQQLEKMKCCANCIHIKGCTKFKPKIEKCDNWSLKE